MQGGGQCKHNGAVWSGMRAAKTPWQENRRHHNCDKSLFFTRWQHLTMIGAEHHWPGGKQGVL